jgi:uncharacterized protein (DUF2141 family)
LKENKFVSKIIQRILLLLTLTSFSPLISKSQNSLSIEIGPLKSNKGQVLLLLMDENEQTVKHVFAKITNKTCKIRINGLKNGKYAFKYFHDKNSNKKLDTYWIGIPKESFGFSNNAKAIFGPPDFEKTLFTLNENTSVRCDPQILKLK